MLGAFRKTVIGTGALGLIAVGVATTPAPVTAAPGDNVCVIAAKPADVYNVEYGIKGQGHPRNAVTGDPAQASMGNWTPPGTTTPVPRYGLYYPATDPVQSHAVPRDEDFGQTPGNSVPHTPVQTGDDFMFAQAGTCDNNGAGFSTTGNAIGYCGRSVGLGTGFVNGRASIVRWESVGSQLVFLDPTARGSVNAQPFPDPSRGSCKDGTAITFLVDGALVDATRPT